MSAEILREAAALMRERAEAATPGPWHVCEEPSVDADSVVTGCDHDPVAALMDEWYEVDPGEPTAVDDAAHIASWHPAVALAVADWLSDAAENMELVGPYGELAGHDTFMLRLGHTKALAVANSYLGRPRWLTTGAHVANLAADWIESDIPDQPASANN